MIKRYVFLLIILIMFFTSCNNKKQSNKDVISKKEDKISFNKKFDRESVYLKLLGDKNYEISELNFNKYILWHPTNIEFNKFDFSSIIDKRDYNDSIVFYTRNFLTKNIADNVIINFFETTLENYNCPSCAPAIGVLIEKDNNILYKYLNAFNSGRFGFVNEKSIDVKFYNDRFYIIADWFGMGQGYVMDGKVIYLIEYNNIKEVLNITLGESNEGTADEKLWKYESVFSSEEDINSGYLFFKQFKKGTKLKDNVITNVNEINIYKYDKNKYIMDSMK